MPLAAVLVAVVALAGGSTKPAVVKSAYNAKLHTKLLVAASGRTLYMFADDHGGVSACRAVDGCSQAWPPLLTSGRPKAGAGVKQSLLGAVKRKDGGMQVTYGGHLLYTWVGGFGLLGDEKAGDANGEGVVGAWWVLAPTGKPVKKTP